jgi:sterol carrier protein 2
MAEKRQVKDPKYALQHTVGLGGACVVSMYKKLKPGTPGFSRPDQTSDPAKLEAFEGAETIKKAKAKL